MIFPRGKNGSLELMPHRYNRNSVRSTLIHNKNNIK